eukprot:Awhi_evm1s5996
MSKPIVDSGSYLDAVRKTCIALDAQGVAKMNQAAVDQFVQEADGAEILKLGESLAEDMTSFPITYKAHMKAEDMTSFLITYKWENLDVDLAVDSAKDMTNFLMTYK